MSQPITLDETIEVARPVREVWAYVSDFASIEQWDPAVQRAERLGAGAPGLGSEYRIDMRAGFSLHYRVIGFEPCARLLMTVRARAFRAEETILFEARGERTRVRYIARFRFRAPLALLLRRFPGVLDRVGKATMDGLRAALEERFPAPRASGAVALGDRLVLPGLFGFTRFGYARARRRWKPFSAWLGDRHVVLTGATSGLGLAAARALAARGAALTLVARDRKRADAVARDLRARTGNRGIAVAIADLSLMREVDALAARLLAQGRPVDALINNAGALFNPRRETAEGLEASFALMLLGPYLLTERLQPLLAVAPGGSRVVNVLSGGMYTQRIRVDDLQNRRLPWSGAAAYAHAKRGLMILTGEWAQRWREQGIVVNAMHPGWADTPGVRSQLPAFRRITRTLLRSAEQGADTIVWLAAAPEAGAVSGEFWLDRTPHPRHVFAHTRETPAERAALLAALAQHAAEACTGAKRRR